MSRKFKWLFLGAVFALLMGGCPMPHTAYVEADAATYKAVAPEYRAYVESDGKLDDEQKARRFDTLDTWGERIEAAKENK